MFEKAIIMADNKKIFIVEDDDTFSKVLADALRGDMPSYEVTIARDGEEALKNVESIKPDLIILDLVLPKLGGIDFLTELRKKDDFKNTAVLVLSQLSDVGTLSDLMALGIKGFIIKSDMNLEGIIGRVKSALGEV